MTDRYIYYDPIPVIWMAKNYGMQFEATTLLDYGKPKIIKLYPSPFCNKEGLVYVEKREKRLLGSTELACQFHQGFYIDPDSYHILESINKVTRAALKLVGLWPEKETIEEGAKN
jgi:hypothetical protein